MLKICHSYQMSLPCHSCLMPFPTYDRLNQKLEEYKIIISLTVTLTHNIKLYHLCIIIIGIQPLGRSGQRPELSQATGMALVRCILGKFLGVVCNCFPPRLDVPTFATKCPHIHHDVRDLSGGRWNCGQECCPVILPKWGLPRHLGIFYIPQIYEMGPTALLPLQRKAWRGFFCP
jgi:hypothetical protein